MIDVQERTAQPAGDALLTIREVARALRVDTTTVRRWIKLGILEAIILPHVRTRQAYRVKKSVVDRVLNPSTTGV